MKKKDLFCAMLLLFILCVAVEAKQYTPPPTPQSFSFYGSFDEMKSAAEPRLPKVIALTDGPKSHWFGYYNIHQFDPTNRYVLGMEVDFEQRRPTPEDEISIAVIDLTQENRWTTVGTSRAWDWQAGCRLQWRPGSDREIIWNDREGDAYVCRIHDFRTSKTRTLPYPVFHIHPDGKRALTFDFTRLGRCRPGYGYVGAPEECPDEQAPTQTGVYAVDLETGWRKMLFSVAEIAQRFIKPFPPSKQTCYFNCLNWAPDGSRFLVFHRLSPGNVTTRVVTSSPDGHDVRYLASGSSHFTWRDPDTVLIWSNGYRLYDVGGNGEGRLLWNAPNGHQTYVPGTNNAWLVTDTYPMGPKRLQHLYLYHVPTGLFVPLGRFGSESEYSGTWRCDLHPRLSRDGTKVVIDSPCRANGRQMYLIDIAPILRMSPASLIKKRKR
jgi:hypothetical protein